MTSVRDEKRCGPQGKALHAEARSQHRPGGPSNPDQASHGQGSSALHTEAHAFPPLLQAGRVLAASAPPCAPAPGAAASAPASPAALCRCRLPPPLPLAAAPRDPAGGLAAGWKAPPPLPPLRRQPPPLNLPPAAAAGYPNSTCRAMKQRNSQLGSFGGSWRIAQAGCGRQAGGRASTSCVTSLRLTRGPEGLWSSSTPAWCLESQAMG